MAEKKDYYDVLGVERKASKDQIKDAYRKLAMQFHPDRNKSPEAEERFKEISEAYAVLSDEQKRQQYDTLGHAGFDQQYTPEDIYRGTDFDSVFRDIGFDFGDVFRTIFGGGGGFGGFGGFGEQVNRGQDLAYDLEITLEEAARGVEKEIEIPRTEFCEVCHGSGASPGTDAKICPKCNGAGKVQNMRRNSFTMFVQVVQCPTCRGKGKLIEKPCSNCRGSGLARKLRRINIKIPMGIEDGYQLRLRGEGGLTDSNGEAGDLYVQVNIKPNKLFERDGDNLWHIAFINYPQAALGAEISVPTLEGSATIKIHPGTQAGEVVRLRGKGMPHLRGYGKGDLLIRVGLSVPEKLTSQQRTLLEQLAKELGTDVSSKSHKFRL